MTKTNPHNTFMEAQALALNVISAMALPLSQRPFGP